MRTKVEPVLFSAEYETASKLPELREAARAFDEEEGVENGAAKSNKPDHSDCGIEVGAT